MSVNIPDILTPMHQSEIDENVPFHEELMKKLAANFNFLGNLFPVGAVVFLEVNRSGVVVPDSGIWQLCDGSQITNPDSPLRTIGHDEKFVPDLRGKYPRCAVNQISNGIGGTDTLPTRHNHGGKTGVYNPYYPLEAGSNARSWKSHDHDIGEDLSDTPVAPQYTKYVAYMKVT